MHSIWIASDFFKKKLQSNKFQMRNETRERERLMKFCKYHSQNEETIKPTNRIRRTITLTSYQLELVVHKS